MHQTLFVGLPTVFPWADTYDLLEPPEKMKLVGKAEMLRDPPVSHRRHLQKATGYGKPPLGSVEARRYAELLLETFPKGFLRHSQVACQDFRVDFDFQICVERRFRFHQPVGVETP